MRIDAYNQIANIYKVNKSVKAEPSAKTGGGSDTLEISDAAKAFQTARTAVSNAPEVREDKVEKLRAAIENGTYAVSGKEIAEKLVEKYFSF